MSAGGAAVERIAHVVGHSDTSTTERIYRHELRPVVQSGAVFMNVFAPAKDVNPEWHMDPLFKMPGVSDALGAPPDSTPKRE